MTTLDALVATCARHLRRAGAAKRLEASPRAVEEIARAVCAVSMDDAALRALRAFSRRAEARDARTRATRRRGATTSTPRDATPQPTVTYLRLHAEEDFTVGAFVFDRGQTIPLHNHPGMTVLMRCLFGETRVKAYDFVDDAPRLSTATRTSSGGGNTKRASASDEVCRRRTARERRREFCIRGGRTCTRCRRCRRARCSRCKRRRTEWDEGRDCHYFELVRDGAETGENSILREIAPPPDFVCGTFPRR